MHKAKQSIVVCCRQKKIERTENCNQEELPLKRRLSVCKMTQKEEHFTGHTNNKLSEAAFFYHLIMIDGVNHTSREAAFSLLNNIEKQAFSLGKHSSSVHLYSRCQLHTVRKQDQSSKTA